MIGAAQGIEGVIRTFEPASTTQGSSPTAATKRPIKPDLTMSGRDHQNSRKEGMRSSYFPSIRRKSSPGSGNCVRCNPAPGFSLRAKSFRFLCITLLKKWAAEESPGNEVGSCSANSSLHLLPSTVASFHSIIAGAAAPRGSSPSCLNLPAPCPFPILKLLSQWDSSIHRDAPIASPS